MPEQPVDERSRYVLHADHLVKHTSFLSKIHIGSYLVVAGASLSLFSSVGFLNSFGVFEVYYKANVLQDKSESDISWLGSVSIFMLYILAPLTGVLVDKIGPRASTFSLLSFHQAPDIPRGRIPTIVSFVLRSPGCARVERFIRVSTKDHS